MNPDYELAYNAGKRAFREYFAEHAGSLRDLNKDRPNNPYRYNFADHYKHVGWRHGFDSEARRHIPFPYGAPPP
ncbi:MAG: hypothetical protein ACLQOQ_14555 [Beijerinckiaceae bacterium]